MCCRIKSWLLNVIHMVKSSALRERKRPMKPAMYDALTVSSYVIVLCDSKNKVVSNLKLQKILYFIQAQFLVDKNRACFEDEIQAWTYGPVVPNVYHAYKAYGASYIPPSKRDIERAKEVSTEDKELIDYVVDYCMQYTTPTLVDITHHQRPWREAYKKGENTIITKQAISEYFAEK